MTNRNSEPITGGDTVIIKTKDCSRECCVTIEQVRSVAVQSGGNRERVILARGKDYQLYRKCRPLTHIQLVDGCSNQGAAYDGARFRFNFAVDPKTGLEIC